MFSLTLLYVSKALLHEAGCMTEKRFPEEFPGFVAFIYTYLSILDICTVHLVLSFDLIVRACSSVACIAISNFMAVAVSFSWTLNKITGR